MTRRHWIAILLLALAPVVCYWEVLRGDLLLPTDWVYRDLEPWKRVGPPGFDAGVNEQPRTKVQNSRIKDAFLDSYALDLVSARAARRGDILLWNRHAGGGIPHLAAGFSRMFYPPFWIYAVVEPATARNVEILLHLFLASLFAFLFLTRITGSPLACIPGAIAFGFTPSIVHRAELSFILPTLVWFPLLLLGIEEIVSTGRRRGVVTLAAAMFFQLTAGHYPDILLNVLGASTYGLVRIALDSGGGADKARAVLRCLSAVAIGVASAAPFLFPSLELISHVRRSEQTASALAESGLGLNALGTLFTPWITRSQLYVGLTALVFVPAAFARRSRRQVLALVACFVLGVAMATGSPMVELVMAAVPPVSRLRYVHTMIALGSYALALIAGLGIAHVIDIGSNSARLRRLVWWTSVLACGALALVWGIELAGLSNLGSTRLRLPGLLFVLMGIPLLLEAFARRRVGARLLIAGLSVLIAVELFSYAREFNPRTDPDELPPFPEFGAIEFLRADSEPFRVASLLGNYDTPFWPNTLGAYGIDDIGAYHSLLPAELGDYMEKIRSYGGGASRAEIVEIGETSGNWLMPSAFRPSHLLSLWNVKYVLMPSGSENPDPEWLELVYDDEVRIYRYRAGLERAWMAESALVLPARGVAAMLLDPAFNPRTTVLLGSIPPALAAESSEPFPGVSDERKVDVIGIDHERLELFVEAGAPGFLVLSESYDPGWRATVDGREVQILKANEIFRAIALGGGEHHVRLRYLPPTYVRGYWCLGIVVVIGGVLLFRYRVDSSPWRAATSCLLLWIPIALMAPRASPLASDSPPRQRAVTARLALGGQTLVRKTNGRLTTYSLAPSSRERWSPPGERSGTLRLRVSGAREGALHLSSIGADGHRTPLAILRPPAGRRRWGLHDVPVSAGTETIEFETRGPASVPMEIGSPLWMEIEARRPSVIHVIDSRTLPADLDSALRAASGLKIFLSGRAETTSEGDGLSEESIPHLDVFDEVYDSQAQFDARLHALLPALYEVQTELVVVPPVGEEEVTMRRLTHRLDALGISSFVEVRSTEQGAGS